ncbi:tetratricopeptide repeat protein [Methylibium sp.]|uniref:tetratricopeptide repeat protein n=1 Tax=Methylibium sp. TaxID=2067992 RepID=UPI003D0E5530
MTTISLLHRALLLCSASVLLTACAGKAERIESHLKQGNQYARQADWDKASLEVRNVLQMNPKQAEAYYLAAQVEEGRREVQRAYGYYMKAVELKPDYNDAKSGLARIYMMAGEADKAEQAVGEILAADADHVSALTLKAALLARRGDSKGAIEQANRLIASKKTIPVEPSMLLAGLYANQGDEAKALQVIQAALKDDPKNISLLAVAAQLSSTQKADPAAGQKAAVGYYKAATEAAPRNAEVWNVWAVYHARRNELDPAEQVLRDAVRAQPDDTQRTLSLLDFLATRRGFDVAEKEFLAVISARPKEAALRFGLVNLYKAANRPDDAQRVLKDIIDTGKETPGGLAARNQLAAYKLAANQLGEARSLLDEVLKASPRDAGALVLRGRLSLIQGNARDAVIDLRAAAKDQPGSPEVVGLLAQAHRTAREPQLAREVLADAVKAQPNNAELRLLSAADMAASGDAKAALAEADEILKVAPDNVRAYEFKARLAVGNKDWATAEKALLALKGRYPKEAVGYLRLGQLYAEQKRFDAALKQYDDAAQLAPGAPEPVLAGIGLLIGQGKFDAVNTRIDTLMRADPNNVLPYQLKGEAAMARRDLATAQQAYEKVVEMAPSVPNGYQGLARVLASRNDMPGALAMLDKGQQANPKDLSLPAIRAEWLTRLGRHDEAIAAYEALLKRSPEDDTATNNLAYLLTELKGDKASLDRALELVGRFNESGNAGYLDSLGWVHYKLGQYAQAVPPLERAVERLPGSPLMQLHLGMALYKNGDTERGKELLRKAVQSKAEIPGLGEARKLLGQG